MAKSPPPTKIEEKSLHSSNNRKEKSRNKTNVTIRIGLSFIDYARRTQKGDSLSGLPTRISQSDMQCLGRVVRSFNVASASRQFAFLLCLVLTIGLDTRAVFPKAPAKMENTKQEGF